MYVPIQHGNLGAHGDGSDDETETPIIAWGSGVAHWKTTKIPNKSEQ